jgi:hypothetical protein
LDHIPKSQLIRIYAPSRQDFIWCYLLLDLKKTFNCSIYKLQKNVWLLTINISVIKIRVLNTCNLISDNFAAYFFLNWQSDFFKYRNEKDVPDKLKSASNFLNPASSVKALMEFR